MSAQFSRAFGPLVQQVVALERIFFQGEQLVSGFAEVVDVLQGSWEVVLGLSPQILVLIAYLLWGVVGLLLTDFARPMRIGVQVAGAALLLLTELLLVTGVRETGSAVSWTILTYALEVAELAADGAWLVTPAVVLLGIVWFSVVSLGAFGRHRRAALALSTAGVMLTGLSVLGAPVSRLPRYMSVDALVYLVHSRSAVPDDQRAELRARPVSTGMALEDGLPNGRNVVVVFLESVGASVPGVGGGQCSHTVHPGSAYNAVSGRVISPERFSPSGRTLCRVRPTSPTWWCYAAWSLTSISGSPRGPLPFRVCRRSSRHAGTTRSTSRVRAGT